MINLREKIGTGLGSIGLAVIALIILTQPKNTYVEQPMEFLDRVVSVHMGNMSYCSGYKITNNIVITAGHCVDANVDNYMVYTEGHQVETYTLHGANIKQDVAVLTKDVVSDDEFKAARDQIKDDCTGDLVTSYGYPGNGIGLTISKGKIAGKAAFNIPPDISALEYTFTGTIYPGMSGGPVMSGSKVCGVNSGVYVSDIQTGYDRLDKFFKELLKTKSFIARAGYLKDLLRR